MSVHVLRADARQLPLADATVDLVVTSPPYWGLRAYGAGPGEIGSQTHWQDWLDALLQATAEMARVLKPEGSIFVNLGDKYQANRQGFDRSASTLQGRHNLRQQPVVARAVHDKSLLGLPWRYALGCIDHLGLLLRAELVWSKPSALPESAHDRVRRTHETWFHLVKQPRYYAAVDEIREPHSPGTHPGRTRTAGSHSGNGTKHRTFAGDTESYSPLGRLPGSVWTIASEPLHLPTYLGIEHYAAFGTEWPRRLILGWSPSGICLACGQGRFPVAHVAAVEDRRGRTQGRHGDSLSQAHGPDGRAGQRYRVVVQVVGDACACTPFTDHPERRGTSLVNHTTRAERGTSDGNGGERFRRYQEELANPRGPVREYHLDRWTPPPTRPAVILDPFGGTGTVAHVAHALGRVGISVDLSADYCRIAADPTLARRRAAKAHGRTWAERQLTLDEEADE